MPEIVFTPSWDGSVSRFSDKRVSWIATIPKVTAVIDSCRRSLGLNISYSGQSLAKDDCDERSKTDLLTWSISSYVDNREILKLDYSIPSSLAEMVISSSGFDSMRLAVLGFDTSAVAYGRILESRASGRLLRRYSIGFDTIEFCGLVIGAKRTIAREIIAFDLNKCEQYVAEAFRIESRTSNRFYTSSSKIFPDLMNSSGASAQGILSVPRSADRDVTQDAIRNIFASSAGTSKSLGI